MPLFGCRLRVWAQTIEVDLKHMGLLLVFHVQCLYCHQSPAYSLCLHQEKLFLRVKLGCFGDDVFYGMKHALGGKVCVFKASALVSDCSSGDMVLLPPGTFG